MLGSMVTRVLSKDPEIQVIPIGHDSDFNALDPEDVSTFLDAPDWVINCIGIIKPHINNHAEEAIRVNSLFPYVLAQTKRNIIQIATDCVFSGSDNLNKGYTEKAEHDPLDIYGKTKSLGEVHQDNFYNIRCSIIGPKQGNPSLLQWFLDLPKGAEINGYTSHKWNGVTTLAFAEVCRGIIKGDKPEVNDFHLIPKDSVTKYDLLKLMSWYFKRDDIKINPVFDSICNRKLATLYPKNNEKMWQQASYEEPPMIKDLLNDLSVYL
jgi:dTDP-4-dehydrorhamnose reductase